MRLGCYALALWVLAPTQALAEWQIKPFVGVAGNGSTTFLLVNPDGSKGVVLGANLAWLGEVIGVEGDIGHAPGFFSPVLSSGSGASDLIVGSSVTTATGNLVIAMPRHLTDYTLRLYFVAGAGMMRVAIEGANDALGVSERLAAFDLGGGATGFLTKRIGLNWEVRRFRSFGAIDVRNSNSPLGPEPFGVWRATMAVAIRY